MGILKIIFVIFLLTFTLGEVFRFDLGNNLFVKPIDFVTIVLVLAWLVREIRVLKQDPGSSPGLKVQDDKKGDSGVSASWRIPRMTKGQSRMTGPILLFVSIALISLLVNVKYLSHNEFIASFSYLLRWVLYVGLYYVVKSFPFEFKKKIIYILIATGALIVLFGFIQYFFYSNLRNLYYLGWDEHMYRLFSTFLDPNFAGAFFVLYLIFLSGLLLYFLKNKQKSLVILSVVILLSTLLGIYLTFSRSALIMLFVSAFTFLILIKKTRLLIGLVLVSLIFFLLSSKYFYIENINLFRIASTEARLISARSAIEIIQDNPLLGVGFNGYRYAQIRYGLRHGENAIRSHADAGTDNSFLFVLATTGIVGLLSYLYLLFSILKRAQELHALRHAELVSASYRVPKQARNDMYSIRNVLSIIVIASFVGIIVDSLFVNSLFYSFNMIWLWTVLGLLHGKDSSR